LKLLELIYIIEFIFNIELIGNVSNLFGKLWIKNGK